MVLNKWAVPILQLAFVVFTALQVLRGDQTPTGLVTFIGVTVGAVFTVYLPLTTGRWAAALKVLSAVFGALIAALMPLVTQTWTIDSWIILALAIVNALVVQFGVDARLDGVSAAIADPAIPDSVIAKADPAAYRLAA